MDKKIIIVALTLALFMSGCVSSEKVNDNFVIENPNLINSTNKDAIDEWLEEQNKVQQCDDYINVRIYENYDEINTNTAISDYTYDERIHIIYDEYNDVVIYYVSDGTGQMNGKSITAIPRNEIEYWKNFYAPNT